ncbi:MAG: valine--tRNA ligase [Candidatus Dadabacteria bacterium]|nr:valine--tRNA ligase [Candidatus Dadabacteria bacterium]MDE0663705.1 valine--tRNA ligase [Candidatus Dadabacteria bacterium]
MEKSYNPAEVERRVYDFWISSGLHKSEIKDSAEVFSIVIPPPNVTGSLHIGHALNNTIQDILVRYKRMNNFDVLWVPGTDHAGIATQMMVEKNLASEGLTKNDLGREKFLERIWQWKENSGNRITEQLKRLGALPDWEMERFTLDEGLSEAVREVFVDLYSQGLIYKDKRLVNWDPKLRTAISDLEVEQRETQGNYWYIRYPIEGDDGLFVTVATTRPETMLGDTAVAVHPEDPRYADLVGRNAILPLVGRNIPVIADEYSDPEKGTGAVKITPGHDFNDFEVGKRNGLDILNILDERAHVRGDVPEKYVGLERFEARKAVIQDLEEGGFLVKVEQTTHTVPYGDRSGVIVEPWLTDQWYVNTKELAAEAISYVERGEIRFYPEFWENTYFEWMRNIEPWCISRQLWWGHRIPAWYGPDGEVFVAVNEREAAASAKKHYGEEVKLVRDPDVLDTWFSSGLWPFSTLGWPAETEALRHYYPTSCLVTGFDIIFFWVARMIMLGLKFMKDVPFRDVYVHGLIRDAKGRKMSKTTGNVIDPIDVIEKYGADALRFSLAALAAQGRDIKLTFPVIEGYRNFMNKIWNATRFVFMNLEPEMIHDSDLNNSCLSVPDRWILSRLNFTLAEVEEFIEDYEFDKASQVLYHFIWDDCCDWYLEISKFSLYGDDSESKKTTLNVLVRVLVRSLRALHPFTPYITEEIFRIFREKGVNLPKGEGLDSKSILETRYPKPKESEIFKEESGQIELVKSVVTGIRNLRAIVGIHPSEKVSIHLNSESSEVGDVLRENLEIILGMASLADCVVCGEDIQGKTVSEVVSGVEIIMPVENLLDLEKEISRLSKDLAKVTQELKKTEGKLANRDFIKRAPEDVVEKEKGKLDEFQNHKKKLEEILGKLSDI